jgi:hypothetical protein
MAKDYCLLEKSSTLKKKKKKKKKKNEKKKKKKKKKKADPSETVIHIYQTIWRHVPKDSNLHIHRGSDDKSHKELFLRNTDTEKAFKLIFGRFKLMVYYIYLVWTGLFELV